MADGKVTIDTQLNNKGFTKGLNSMKAQTNGLTGAVKKLGAAIGAAFAVRELIEFGKECVELGSNVAEVQNVVDVAFGDMSYKIEAFADTAIQNFGMSQLAAKKTASTYMAMAKGMGMADEAASNMAISLTGMTGDVASFFNLDQDAAATKLKSVFTGETESLKDLGVVMTQANLEAYALEKGITKDIDAMTQAEKVALRYGFVMDSLALANGDFARTSDSWANQTRILSMQWEEFMSIIGQAIITVLTPLVKILNAIVSRLISMAHVFRAVVEAIFGTQQQAEGVSGAISDSVENQEDLTEATEGTAKAQKTLLAGFDEINKIGSESAENAYSGLSGLDFGGLSTSIEDGISSIEEIELPKWAQVLVDNMDHIKKAALITGTLIAGWSISSAFGTALTQLSSLSRGKKLVIGFTFATAGLTLLFDHFEALKSGEITKESLSSVVRSVLEGAALTIGGASIISGIAGVTFGMGLLIALPISFSAVNFAIEMSDEQGQAAIDNFKQILLTLFTDQTWEESIGNLMFGEEAEKSIWERIAEIFSTSGPGIASASKDLNDAFKSLGDESTWTYLKAINDALANGESIGPVIKKWFDNEVAPWFTGEVWEDMFSGGISDGFSDAWSDFEDWWNEDVSTWWREDVKPWFTKEKWTEIMKGVRNAIPETFKNALNVAIEKVNQFITWLNQKLNISWGDKYILGKKIISAGSIQLVNIPHIPRLATGAVIPPNREFLAVLGDQRSGTNIEAPEELIRKIVREESGGMNTELLEAILAAIKAGHVMKVNKKVLAETAVEGINDMTRSAGKSVLTL